MQSCFSFCFLSSFFLLHYLQPHLFSAPLSSLHLSVWVISRVANDCQAVCCDNGLTIWDNELTVGCYTPRLLASVTYLAGCSVVLRHVCSRKRKRLSTSQIGINAQSLPDIITKIIYLYFYSAKTHYLNPNPKMKSTQPSPLSLSFCASHHLLCTLSEHDVIDVSEQAQENVKHHSERHCQWCCCELNQEWVGEFLLLIVSQYDADIMVSTFATWRTPVTCHILNWALLTKLFLQWLQS